MNIDLAWATGLFEGEGHMTASGNHPYAYLGTTDRDVLDRFYEIIGVGKIRPKSRQAEPHHKPLWSWYATGPNAITAIRRMYPLLGNRRRATATQMLLMRHTWDEKRRSPKRCACGTWFYIDASITRSAPRTRCGKKCRAVRQDKNEYQRQWRAENPERLTEYYKREWQQKLAKKKAA